MDLYLLYLFMHICRAKEQIKAKDGLQRWSKFTDSTSTYYWIIPELSNVSFMYEFFFYFMNPRVTIEFNMQTICFLLKFLANDFAVEEFQ